MNSLPPLHHQLLHLLQVQLLAPHQLIHRIQQVPLHLPHAHAHLPVLPTQLLQLLLLLQFLLADQVAQPLLLRNQLQIFVDLFLQIFDLSRTRSRYLIELCYRQSSVFLVSIQFLEDLPSSVEVVVDGSAIPIDGEAVGESGFYFFVPLGHDSVNAALLELSPVIIIGHAIVFEFFGVEGDFADRLQVGQSVAFIWRFYFELLVCQKLFNDFVLAYHIDVEQHVEHALEFELSIVEEGFIDASEVAEIGLDAFFGRQLWEDAALILFVEVLHEIFELGVPAIDSTFVINYFIFDDGVEEVLSELVVAWDLNLFLAEVSQFHELCFWEGLEDVCFEGRLGDIAGILIGYGLFDDAELRLLFFVFLLTVLSLLPVMVLSIAVFQLLRCLLVLRLNLLWGMFWLFVCFSASLLIGRLLIGHSDFARFAFLLIYNHAA